MCTSNTRGSNLVRKPDCEALAESETCCQAGSHRISCHLVVIFGVREVRFFVWIFVDVLLGLLLKYSSPSRCMLSKVPISTIHVSTVQGFFTFFVHIISQFKDVACNSMDDDCKYRCGKESDRTTFEDIKSE